MNPFEDLPMPSALVNSSISSSINEEQMKSQAVDEDRPSCKRQKVSRQKEDAVTDVSDTKPLTLVERSLATLSVHLQNDKKLSRAAKIFVDLATGELQTATAPLFFNVLEQLMSNTARDILDKKYSTDYAIICEAVEANLEVFEAHQKYRCRTFILYSTIRKQLTTDDSFAFAKACRAIKTAVLSLSTYEECVFSDHGSDCYVRMQEGLEPSSSERIRMSEDEVMERQRVLLMCVEGAFRNHHWSWAKQPCAEIFDAVSGKRMFFSEPLRDELDDLTTAFTLSQRKNVSWSGLRTIRTCNSTAHPLLNKGIDIVK